LASPAKYLLDASAIYPLILRLKEGLLLYKDHFAVLDLTIYEVDNALLKAHKKGAIKHLAPVAKMFEEIMKGLRKLSIKAEMFEVLDIAAKSGLTFYDASYAYVARREGLKLVTEDSELLRFLEAITVEALLRELRP